MSFSGDMKKFSGKTADAHDKITRAATLELFSGVVKSTPVKTGRARGEWQVSVGNPVNGENGRSDAGGSAAIAEIEANSPEGAGQVTYMTNNLPYIVPLEEGSSKQAPEGFVRKNLDRVQRIVDAAISKHRV